MFFQDDEDQFTGVEEDSVFVRSESVTYEDIVKDLVLEENQYLRDLLMIIKLFREPFATLFPGSKVASKILSIYHRQTSRMSYVEKIFRE